MAISPPTNGTLADATGWPTAITNEVNSMPAGVLGYVSRTTSQSGITTMTDITGQTVTFTADSARYYKVTVKYLIAATVNGDYFNVWLRNGSNTNLQVNTGQVPNTAFGVGGVLEHILTGVSGSYTVKVSLERAGGTGTVTYQGNTVFPCFILVEDLGS